MNANSTPSLLITGHLGFVGQTLLREYAHLDGGNAYEFKTLPNDLDICNPKALESALEEIRPDAVLHLAAQSFVPESFKDPSKTLAVNLNGTLNLLQGLDKINFHGRMLYVSSADVYGFVEENQLPITEDAPPAPRNPYAVSKLAAEYLCQQWSLQASYDILIARPFNHIGPGQDERFVWSSLTRQIAAIELGQQESILKVGNLSVSRDFSAVEDVLQAYIDLLRIPQSSLSGTGIYNICSGQEIYLDQLLVELINERGLVIDVQIDPDRLRAIDQVRAVGSSRKIKDQVSWSAKRSVISVLHHMVEDWKRKLCV
jgi:GDP-4-dehydro-6-deoxy-D-mannose reductase